MLQITVETIRSWNPCYDPTKHLKETWKGTILDLLQNKDIPACDKVWLATRPDVLTSHVLRLFSEHCDKQQNDGIKTENLFEGSDVEFRDIVRYSYSSCVGSLSQQEYQNSSGSLYKASMARHQIERDLIKVLIKLVQQHEV